MKLTPLLTVFTLTMPLLPHVNAEQPGKDNVVGTMGGELKILYDGLAAAGEQLRDAQTQLQAEKTRWHRRRVHGIKIRQSERDEHAVLIAKLESRFKAAKAAYEPLCKQFKEAAEAEFPKMGSVAHSAWFVQEDQIGWTDRPVTYIFSL